MAKYRYLIPDLGIWGIGHAELGTDDHTSNEAKATIYDSDNVTDAIEMENYAEESMWVRVEVTDD